MKKALQKISIGIQIDENYAISDETFWLKKFNKYEEKFQADSNS